jgi:hypothetical protein
MQCVRDSNSPNSKKKFRMCGSLRSFGGEFLMPAIMMTIKRISLSLFFLAVLLSGSAWAQSTKNTSQSRKEAGKSAEQAAAKTGTSSPAAAIEPEQEEAKGPWHGLTWRLIGPFRGGRVLAVSGVNGDQNTYYFGGVGGGVWKTTDGGLTWRPMTDKVKDMSPSIGAVAVAPSDANVVYAGTGEACIRGNIIAGNGVYKSTDAGKTWSYSGLHDTLSIGRIIVHPKNPDIAFVAAPILIGESFAQLTAAKAGTKFFSKTKTPAALISLSIPRIPTRCLPACGRYAARLGAWTAAAPAAVSIARQMAATPGSTFPATDCRMARSAASA